jgi:ubiquinone/menaquinone biosynthesis C-methylase UbiE
MSATLLHNEIYDTLTMYHLSNALRTVKRLCCSAVLCYSTLLAIAKPTMTGSSTAPLFLANLTLGDDGIWGNVEPSQYQKVEQTLREEVANAEYDDYLLEISKHHSIEVMDKEVKDFIQRIPVNGVICDVGGCWGWHWRNLHIYRPDISVVIVDFVRANLQHARKLLGDVVGSNIFLVHGDATNLSFKDEIFDGYWSVQTLQHIPDLRIALREAKRVLKEGGVFTNYSLNNSSLMQKIYSFFQKEYVIDSFTSTFYLRRDNVQSCRVYLEYFYSKSKISYSEILFKPEFRIWHSGRTGSLLGKIDSLLSGDMQLLGPFARQISVHAIKPTQLPLSTIGQES